MNLSLRPVEDPAEAIALAPELEACAAAALEEFRDEPLPAGVGQRLAEQTAAGGDALLLVAEESETGRRRGLCAVAPLVDPLTGERLPMIVVLSVDPDLRHRGVARALAGEARRVLARRGFPHLAARAGHNDDALISMAERWGYVRTWELLVHEG